MLPPVVTILYPEDNTQIAYTDVSVRFAIRSPSDAPVSGIKILVDGRPAKTTPYTMIKKQIYEASVVIPQKRCNISVIVSNRHSPSEPATVHLKWRSQQEPKPGSTPIVTRPTLYILSVGVSQYENKSISLRFPAKDANDFANVMLKQKNINGLYKDVNLKILTNEQANATEIVKGLEWIRKAATSEDVAMLFFSGHGLNDDNGDYYFLPSNIDVNKLMSTGIHYSTIETTVKALASKVLVFIDTCHAGNVWSNRKMKAADTRAVANKLSAPENGAVIFTSSTGKQNSREDPAWSNGAFTKALVEGINGQADFISKGIITVNELELYLSNRVRKLTDELQTPATAKPDTIPDFPIALTKIL